MSLFTKEQFEFALSKNKYMPREEAIEFLKFMNIKHSVGHWSAGDFVDRFAPLGYNSDNPDFSSEFEHQCQRTKAAGIDYIEIHQIVFEKTLNGDIDYEHIKRAQDDYLPELGMEITACNFNTWGNPMFKLGGPCNPDPDIRARALDELYKGLEISKEFGIKVMSVWPGSDGADYHFQIDYRESLEWFAEALITINKECIKNNIKLALESKPYEPRELFMIIPTAASAVLVAKKVNEACGGNNCGLTIDYGHLKMEATTASAACDLAYFSGVPVHKFDVNDARQGRNDQDLMFGTISTVESVEYLYTTFLRDYDGFYSQDQFSYRSDPTRAMERSMINFANLSLKAIKILHENDKLNDARAKGDAPTILDQISPFLVG